MHLRKLKFALLQFLSSQSVISSNWLLENVNGAATLGFYHVMQAAVKSFNFLIE